MLNNTPSQEAIVQIAHIPATGNGSQESILTPRTVRSTEHADILLILGRWTLPRDTLEVGGVEGNSIQSLASARARTVAMEDRVVQVGLAGDASRGCFAQKPEVPL